MPAKYARLDEPERQLADRLMSIAESRSVRALGVACCSAVGELTGSPTVGLYLLEGAAPDSATVQVLATPPITVPGEHRIDESVTAAEVTVKDPVWVAPL